MDILSRPADEFVNDSTVEFLWAQKAFSRAEIYLNLIKSTDPANLKLTPYDDEIYKEFRKDFEQFDVSVIDENQMKNSQGKEKWREFCEKFSKIEDYNEGTLLRTDCKGSEIAPESVILVHRIQFLAIELARNREHFNQLHLQQQK